MRRSIRNSTVLRFEFAHHTSTPSPDLANLRMAPSQKILSTVLIDYSGMKGTGSCPRHFPLGWAEADWLLFETSPWVQFQMQLDAALTACRFTKITRFKSLLVVLKLVPDHIYVPNAKIFKQGNSKSICASKFVRWVQFAAADERETLAIKAGLVSQALLDVCRNFSLDEEPILQLLQKWPVPDAPLSRLPLRPIEQVPQTYKRESSTATQAISNEELSWKHSYNRCTSILYPLTNAQLESISASTQEVSVYQAAPFSADDFIRIANALQRAPEAMLRTWGTSAETGTSLELLKFFPNVAALDINGLCDENSIHLQYASPQLRELSIGGNISFDVLSRFTSLKLLSIQGASPDLNGIEKITSLERLSISETIRPNLDRLKQLKKLRSLSVSSSSIVDLAPITSLGSIQYLNLSCLLNQEVSALSKARSVEYLALDTLCFVEQLPSLEELAKLRRIAISRCRKLNSLTAVSKAPLLRDLIVSDLPSVSASDFSCFKGHPALKHVWTNLGPRKGVAIEKLLKLYGLGARSIFDFSDIDE